VSTPDLAAAVSNTGGLGSIGIGASTVAAAQRMIEETRARTSGLLGSRHESDQTVRFTGMKQELRCQ
jgi:NAD(P)H-dependent flavin oxidoreductase YrpB (nitropropane dioxygenase family)